MSKLRTGILIALVAVSTLAVSESVRRAVAQDQTDECEEDVSAYQAEVRECLDKATTLQQAKTCADDL